jgi:hypothetical protein
VDETTVTTPGELEIRVERVFDAPRASGGATAPSSRPR